MIITNSSPCELFFFFFGLSDVFSFSKTHNLSLPDYVICSSQASEYTLCFDNMQKSNICDNLATCNTKAKMGY